MLPVQHRYYREDKLYASFDKLVWAQRKANVSGQLREVYFALSDWTHMLNNNNL